jgi:hypothetical protein
MLGYLYGKKNYINLQYLNFYKTPSSALIEPTIDSTGLQPHSLSIGGGALVRQNKATNGFRI